MPRTPLIGRALIGLWRWGLKLVLLAFALAVLGSLVVLVALPRATSGGALTVLTGSMTPQIPVGSVVLVRPVDPRTLRAGDVATYQATPGEESFITHRVVRVHDDGPDLSFTFKGDANRSPDLERIPAGAVHGQVWFHVPYLGAVRDALHGKAGLTLLVMLILGGYALAQLGSAFGDSRRVRKPSTQPDFLPGSPAPAVERALVLVQLALPADQTPLETAGRWGGLVVGETSSTVTLLLAPPDGGLAATLELLGGQEPLRVQVWEPPAWMESSPTTVGSPAPSSAVVDSAVRQHVS